MGFIRFLGNVIAFLTVITVLYNGYTIYKSKDYLSTRTLITILVAVVGISIGDPLMNVHSKAELTTAKEHSERIESKEEHSESIKESVALSRRITESNSKKEAKSTSTSSVSNSESSNNKSYKDINTLYDLNDMSKYSDDDLFSADVILPNFYVKDAGADKMGKYHLLLTPTDNSHQEFLAVGKTKQKVRVGSTISVKGTINGRGKVNQTQINNGIDKKFLGDDTIAIIMDGLK
ncbi:MAG: hypothetical protein LIR10_07025 [Bacillota bacterium]|nr:hypothetical protein [Bacillota bacterium]